MRKAIIFIFLFFPYYVYADGFAIMMNTVSYQTTVRQWATTQTAKVKISINATTKDQDIAKVQQAVLTKLSKITSGHAWHIETFQRSQDQSGLERLHWVVSARLPQSLLIRLREAVSATSFQGMKFVVSNINFQPSLVELEKVRSLLREKIYQQAKRETQRLNQIYPTQRYFVHNITFSGLMPITTFQTRQPTPGPYVSSNQQVTMNIGRQVSMTARVDLAAVGKTYKKSKQ